MGRFGTAAVTAFGAVLGMGTGLVISRVATKGSSSKRATIVLASSVAGAAAGAGVASYASAPSLQLNA
jgi:hypothetical protein